MSTAKIFQSCLVLGLLSWFGLAARPVYAGSFVIHAVVPPQASSFQLNLQVNPVATANQNSVLTYQITYGSYLYYQTDIMVIQANWTQATDQANQQPTDLVSYVPGSATPAEGDAQPVIDLGNRRITWTISPVPRAANQIVSFQLKAADLILNNQPFHYTLTAHLISSGVEMPPQQLVQTYQYQPVAATPTPTPTAQPTPVLTPTTAEPRPSPSPATKSSPSIPIISGIIGALPAIGQSLNNGYRAVTQVPLVGPVVNQVGQTSKDLAKQGAGVASSPAPLVLIGAPAFSFLGSILPYLNWSQVPSLLASLFWRRRRYPWGVVYDSRTKEPLDPVILTLTDSQGHQHQAISDIYGRYQFLVEPGDYMLIAQKSHYQFPSTILANQKSDEVYDDLYFGQKLHIADQASVNVNIPLDPLDADWNQREKERMGLTRRIKLPKTWRGWVFGMGAAWSTFMWLLDHNQINTVIVVVYGVLLIGLIYRSRRHPWGVIRTAELMPLKGAAVNITNLDHPQLKRPPVVTKETGRYAFLVEKGQYQVAVSVPQPDGSYQLMAATPSIHIRHRAGQIQQDITLPASSELHS